MALGFKADLLFHAAGKTSFGKKRHFFFQSCTIVLLRRDSHHHYPHLNQNRERAIYKGDTIIEIEEVTLPSRASSIQVVVTVLLLCCSVLPYYPDLLIHTWCSESNYLTHLSEIKYRMSSELLRQADKMPQKFPR